MAYATAIPEHNMTAGHNMLTYDLYLLEICNLPNNDGARVCACTTLPLLFRPGNTLQCTRGVQHHKPYIDLPGQVPTSDCITGQSPGWAGGLGLGGAGAGAGWAGCASLESVRAVG